MIALAALWWFQITFASGGVQVLKFNSEDACQTVYKVMVAGLASQAPLRDPAETVTVTPCAFGQPPG